MKSTVFNNKIFRIILALLFFFVLSVIYTWPLILHFNEAIFGIWGNRNRYGGDMFSSIYSYWLIKYLIENHLSIFKNPLTIFPFGASGSYAYGLRPIGEVLVGYVMTILSNEKITYNFMIFSSFILSGIVVFLIVWKLTKNYWASLISGFVFSFSPYHLYVSCGWAELCQIYLFPLYFFCLLKVNETKKLIWGIISGLLFAYICLYVLYYGYFAGVATGIFVIFKLIWDYNRFAQNPHVSAGTEGKARFQASTKTNSKAVESLQEKTLGLQPREAYKKSKKIDWMVARNLGIGYVLAIIIVFAGFSKMPPWDMFGGNNLAKYKLDDLVLRSARPLDYILPSIDHPIFGNFSRDLLDNHLKFTHNVFDISLGWLTLGLAIFGSIVFLKKKIQKDINFNFSVTFFIVIAVSLFVLSMPPYFNFLGLKIPLPSQIVFYLTPMFKSVSRYGVIVMCSVSILAGISLDYISRKFTVTKKALLYFFVFIIVLFEFQNKSMYVATSYYEVPSVYQWLSIQPEKFAIAEYPAMLDFDYRNMYYKYFQRLHQKPMMNGAQADSKDDLLRISLFDITSLGTQKILKGLGIKYVVIHDQFYSEYYQLNTSLLHMKPPMEIKGLKLIKTFENERFYEIESTPQKIAIATGGDFYQGEQDKKENVVWHWLANGAMVNFYNFDNQPREVTIKFNVTTVLDSSTLYLVNSNNQGYPLQLSLGKIVPVEIKTRLDPGTNIIKLVSRDQPILIDDKKDIKATVRIWEFSVIDSNGEIFYE